MNVVGVLSLPIPIIVTLHEVQYSQKENIIRKIKSTIVKIAEKNIIHKAAKIIVHSPYQKRFLEEKYHVKNIECIYHGLELMKKNDARSKGILFFGIVSPGKGLEYLIEAAQKLKKNTIFIAGSISKHHEAYKIKLLKKIEELKLTNVKIEFKWINEKEKWDYYRKAGVVVLPYTWAPYQSGVLHNAISCGIPVVVTRVGSLWELVDTFKLGEIVEPRNSYALAKEIQKVLANPIIYRKGIDEYRNIANWNSIAKVHIQTYARTLNI